MLVLTINCFVIGCGSSGPAVIPPEPVTEEKIAPPRVRLDAGAPQVPAAQ